MHRLQMFPDYSLRSAETLNQRSIITRRSLLAMSAGFILSPRLSYAAEGPRLAAIDWAMLETAFALGAHIVAGTEIKQFRRTSVEPALPADFIDLGLRGSPNFELLRFIQPDFILSSPFYAQHGAKFSQIAPVISLPFYVAGEPPFEKALEAVRSLGAKLALADRAAQVVAEAERNLARYRAELGRKAARPIYVINIGDGRHFRAFGADSLFGNIMVRLGLTNAWQGATEFSFAAPVPIERLAEMPEAQIVIVSEIPVEARSTLRSSVLWNALPAVRRNRVLQLENVGPYGGVIAGMRFARLLHKALTEAPE
jgi:ferric hydroxamate transport system substrate-binding protein